MGNLRCVTRALTPPKATFAPCYAWVGATRAAGIHALTSRERPNVSLAVVLGTTWQDELTLAQVFYDEHFKVEIATALGRS